jgi:hypothetical protein
MRSTASLFLVEAAPRVPRSKFKSTFGDFEIEEWTYKPPPRTSKEAELVAVLDAPLMPGETAHFGFQRKEREFVAVLATLTILEAHHLRGRLANPHADDQLALKFARLTIERRTRILAFVADTRRRYAIAASGR